MRWGSVIRVVTSDGPRAPEHPRVGATTLRATGEAGPERTLAVGVDVEDGGCGPLR
jgi:hypothetical protein